MGDLKFLYCLYMFSNFYTLRIYCFNNFLIILHSLQGLNFSRIHLRCQALKVELHMWSRELRAAWAAHSGILTDQFQE